MSELVKARADYAAWLASEFDLDPIQVKDWLKAMEEDMAVGLMPDDLPESAETRKGAWAA